ncbi:MAG: hypothetical protein M3373_05620 [Gemmatimonadota bacterium]|nr:hypothetical protein [Gemmatimonadota bacterium]
MSAKLARVLAVAAIAASPAVAQTPAEPQFETGRYYAGPRVWIGNLNGAVAIGGQVERGFTQPGEYGPGIIAGGIGVDYYSWSQNFGTTFGNGEWKYSVVPIQLFGNYHFVLPNNKKIDPYLGLALVYSHYSSSWSGPFASPGGGSGSTTAFAAQGGARYFVSDKLAVQGQVGFGYGTLGLGVTWKL